MSRRAARRVDDREVSAPSTSTRALEAYLEGGEAEELLQAAGVVIDCALPIDPEHADTISELTGNLDIEIETYGDAAHAIQRWFATMRQPGARH